MNSRNGSIDSSARGVPTRRRNLFSGTVLALCLAAAAALAGTTPARADELWAAGLEGRYFPTVGNHEVWDDPRIEGVLSASPYLEKLGGEWWLPAGLVQPYTPELDALYSVGTILPSVIHRGPMEGDRGDVVAVGAWSDGWWRLEVSRKLDTGSSFDVAIADGTYLCVAEFDQTQTRHSWHLHPLRIALRQMGTERRTPVCQEINHESNEVEN